ncbi:MAG: amidohydrolase family protein, partial [Actinobacteria bacterium]|nr:amidohydrolase family protein [Actinomycetota bacterium]
MTRETGKVPSPVSVRLIVRTVDRNSDGCLHVPDPAIGGARVSSHANELYVHTPIFTAAGRPWAEAMVVSDGRIRYVGDEPTARRIAGDDAVEVDAGGGVILPGFVDGHAHVVSTGELEGHADLWSAHDLAEIQSRVKTWATDHPDAARVRAQGWQHAALHGVEPSRELLDAVVADRPVYVQAFDLHSFWVNSAALTEL